jgi:hypothetical protein
MELEPIKVKTYKHLIGVEPIHSCSENKRCSHLAKDVYYKYF